VSKERRRDAEFLMFLGVLIAGLCGSCTLYFRTTSSYDHAWAGVALIVGGVPALFGALMFIKGFRRWRRARDDD
jgi:hypothetical protein